MKLIDDFANKPNRWNTLKATIYFKFEDIKDWFLRWIYAQHNARVIIDFESRMSAVICAATGGMMSKPYYREETMLQVIEEYHSKLYDDGYKDGHSDGYNTIPDYDLCN